MRKIEELLYCGMPSFPFGLDLSLVLLWSTCVSYGSLPFGSLRFASIRFDSVHWHSVCYGPVPFELNALDWCVTLFWFALIGVVVRRSTARVVELTVKLAG